MTQTCDNCGYRNETNVCTKCGHVNITTTKLDEIAKGHEERQAGFTGLCRDYAKYCNRVFATHSVDSICNHLLEEVEEARARPVAEELADIQLLLIDLANISHVDLLDAARAKAEVVYKREWMEQPDGGHRHT